MHQCATTCVCHNYNTLTLANTRPRASVYPVEGDPNVITIALLLASAREANPSTAPRIESGRVCKTDSGKHMSRFIVTQVPHTYVVE